MWDRLKVIVPMLLVALLSAQTVSAQQSQLQQQILAPDCSSPGSCVMKAPTITSINEREGRPFIIGTYDAAFTKTLRVILGGRLYVPGQDEELTVQGDEWRLDLRTLQSPLISGSYELIVEAVSYGGDTKKTDSNFTLMPGEIARPPIHSGGISNPGGTTDMDAIDTPATRPDETNPPVEDQSKIPQPLDPARNESRMIVLVIAVLAVILGGYGVFLAVRRYRLSDKKNVV